MPQTTFNIRPSVAIQMLNDLGTSVDGGAGTFPTTFRFYSSSLTLLASHTIANPAFIPAVNNTTTGLASIVLSAQIEDVAIDATGKVTDFTAHNKDGLCIFSGPVVKTGDAVPASGAIIMAVTDLVAGIPSKITSYSVSLPTVILI